MDALYPGYGFAGHKGYGAPTHAEALSRLGPCAIHRMTWAPIRALLEGASPPSPLWGGTDGVAVRVGSGEA